MSRTELDLADLHRRIDEAIARHDAPAAREVLRSLVAASVDVGEPPAAAELGMLARVPILAGLEGAALLRLARDLEVRSFVAGERIVTEGEPGRSLFAIVRGSVDVVRSTASGWGDVPAHLGPGEFFGEMALVAEVPRLANVVAMEPTLVFEISAAQVDRLVVDDPRAAAVLLGFFKHRLLEDVVGLSPVLASLEPAQRVEAVDRFRLVAVEAGSVFVREGEPGSAFFVLLRGRASVESTAADGSPLRYPELGEGSAFGEIALLNGKSATATVRALERCVVLQLPSDEFGDLLEAAPGLREALLELAEVRLNRSRAYVRSTSRRLV